MNLGISLGGLLALIPSVLGIPLDTTSFSQADTIQRDIAIIGGGATGTYAAIRLKDQGKTVVVVEKDGELGGHAQTYTTSDGVRVNYGVSSFQNKTVVLDFFSRFNIPLTQYKQIGIGDKYADFATGQSLPDGTIPAPDFTGYLAQLDKYPYLEYSWDLPQPVPEDLLLPFSKFVEKHNLQDVAYIIALFAAGNGNVLDQTTVYVMKLVDRQYLEGIAGKGVMPARYDTHELYEKALTALGSDALLSSTVTAGSRSKNGIQLVVKTRNGRKLIKAKKLLITAPPKLNNLDTFDLDKKERGIFSQFESKALYVALVKNTGLTAGYRYYNADIDSMYHIPEYPALQMIWATRANNTYWAWYSSPTEKSEATVKSDIIAAVKHLAPTSDPQVIAYDSHSPSTVGVTAEAIRKGFYNDLKSLQGHRNTWYTGSTFLSDHSAHLWNFTEYEILPALRS